MTSDSQPTADASQSALASTDDTTTGLPGLSTWRGVYLFVIVVFVAYVVVLLALSGRFS